MKMIRRLVAIVLACVLPAAAFAQAYPSRPIALVVPFAPALLGRGPLLLVVNKDLGPRDLGEQLRHELDGWRRVVHEGRPQDRLSVAMAIKATIFRAELQVSDMDRGHFASHSLTLARHPSETDERMMVRLLAFALDADEALEFGRGLSAEDEPDLVERDLTGSIELWIDVGLPDEREIRKASGRAKAVKVYTYGGRGAALWWSQNEAALKRLGNVSVIEIPEEVTARMTAWAERNMRVECTIQEGQLWLSCGEETLHFEPRLLKEAA